MSTPAKQKIAATFLTLSPMEAAETLRKLEEYEVLKVGDALLKYGHICFNLAKTERKTPAEEAELEAQQELSSFIKAYSPQRQLLDNTKNTEPSKKTPPIEETQSFLRIIADNHSSLEVIRALYRIAFGSKKAEKLIRTLIQMQLSEDFSFLHAYSAQKIHQVIRKENALIISFIMEILHADKAAKLLTLFSQEQRAEIISSIAKRAVPNIQVCQTIKAMLKNKLKQLDEKEREMPGGISTLTNIMKHLPFSHQEQLINNISDTEIKADLEKNIVTWELIRKLPQTKLQELCQAISDEELALILCLKEAGSHAVLSLAISKNRLQLVQEEMQVMLSTTASKGKAEEAKRRFFSLAKQSLHFIDEIVV